MTKNKNKKINEKTDPKKNGTNISFIFFLSNKQIINTKKIITKTPYTAGVCFDKNDKHNKNGIIERNKNFLELTTNINI